jgi:hypothetical protein
MKRFRKRYILLSFSSSSPPIQEQSKHIDELLRSNRIRASIVQCGPSFLIYRCSHRLVDDFRKLFPLILPDNARVTVKGVSGTLKRLRDGHIQTDRKHLS